LSEARPLLGRPLAALTAVAVLGLAYGLLFPDRPDYLGHFLAGAGGTFLLLAVVAVFRPLHPLVVVAGVTGAVVLGASMEASIFRLALFDPVDLANQSIGAVLAGIGLLDAQGDDSATGLALVGGLVLLVAGFLYAFA
jgi:hypothetical protein